MIDDPTIMMGAVSGGSGMSAAVLVRAVEKVLARGKASRLFTKIEDVEKKSSEKIAETEGRLRDIEMEMVKNYVSKNEFSKLHEDMNSKLDKVIDSLGQIRVALERKVDR